MIILGLNAYHADSAACILRNGQLVAAAEEERFRRIKHWAGFPSESISYCLQEAGVRLSDVTHVAINRNNRSNLGRKLAYVIRSRPSVGVILDRLRNRAKWASVAEELAEAFPSQRFTGTVENVEHHFAHLASAFYASPYRDALAVSVDGFGDFASAAWGHGSDNKLALEGRVLFPHSLGIFYQAMTQYLGFPNYGDEYKLMGLAAYGEAGLIDEVHPLLALKADGTFELDLKYFRHHREDVAYEWQGGAPSCSTLFSKELEHQLGPARSRDGEITKRTQDLAFATQSILEEALFHLLNTLQRKHGGDSVSLAGGCAYNSVANGKIASRTPYKNIYLQSAAGDAGGAIGAALSVWHRHGGTRSGEMTHAYWGPQFRDADAARLLASRNAELTSQGCTVTSYEDDNALYDAVARAIADGHVVGWFQGRMEWGPRALGNRSILGDPRRADMKNILNLKIKRREPFRPFAPSVLREAVSDWFERDDDVPFMMKVLPIRASRRGEIPAVTHIDGTGRLQTVHRDTNPRYYRLIETFGELTGVPMVLNTSFNENEPVVCRLEEALDCFLRTEMDMLVLNNYVVIRHAPKAI